MIKKIPTPALRPGMFVVDTGLSWMDNPYLFATQGEVDANAIESLRKEGYKEVFVDTGKGHYDWHLTTDKSDEQQVRDGVAHSGNGRRRERAPLAEEVEKAKILYDDSLNLAREFMTGVAKDGEVDYQRSQAFVEEVIGSVTRNPDAMVSLTKLRSFDEYTYTHCVNVSVLATAFGDFMGLGETELRDLGMAALFHDLGKALVSQEILNKPGKLTEEEFNEMKQHPVRSFKILRDRGNVPKAILRGIVEHHEKFNAKGYPRSLGGDDIHPFARIISVTDVYDALSSRRVYKPPMSPNKALTIIYGMRGQDFHPGHAERFIKFMGIFPVGSLVRLSTGEHAVVTGSNPDSPLRPTITIAFDSAMKPKARVTIDLAVKAQGTAEIKIEECLDHEAVGVDPAAILAEATA